NPVERAAGIGDVEVVCETAADRTVRDRRRPSQVGEEDAAFISGSDCVSSVPTATGAVDYAMVECEAIDVRTFNAKVLKIIELHILQLNVMRIVEVDADPGRGTTIGARLVLNRATRRSCGADARYVQPSTGTGGIQYNAGGAAIGSAAGRNALER